jgi:hypothetical protein
MRTKQYVSFEKLPIVASPQAEAEFLSASFARLDPIEAQSFSAVLHIPL